jgi:hypothetical protein
MGRPRDAAACTMPPASPPHSPSSSVEFSAEDSNSQNSPKSTVSESSEGRAGRAPSQPARKRKLTFRTKTNSSPPPALGPGTSTGHVFGKSFREAALGTSFSEVVVEEVVQSDAKRLQARLASERERSRIAALPHNILQRAREIYGPLGFITLDPEGLGDCLWIATIGALLIRGSVDGLGPLAPSLVRHFTEAATYLDSSTRLGVARHRFAEDAKSYYQTTRNATVSREGIELADWQTVVKRMALGRFWQDDGGIANHLMHLTGIRIYAAAESDPTVLASPSSDAHVLVVGGHALLVVRAALFVPEVFDAALGGAKWKSLF